MIEDVGSVVISTELNVVSVDVGTHSIVDVQPKTDILTIERSLTEILAFDGLGSVVGVGVLGGGGSGDFSKLMVALDGTLMLTSDGGVMVGT